MCDRWLLWFTTFLLLFIVLLRWILKVSYSLHLPYFLLGCVAKLHSRVIIRKSLNRPCWGHSTETFWRANHDLNVKYKSWSRSGKIYLKFKWPNKYPTAIKTLSSVNRSRGIFAFDFKLHVLTREFALFPKELRINKHDRHTEFLCLWVIGFLSNPRRRLYF